MTFIKDQDSLDNLTGQKLNHVGVVLTDGKDIAYLFAMHIWTNQSEQDCFASRWLMFFETVSCICPFDIQIWKWNRYGCLWMGMKICCVVFTVG